MGVLLLLRLLLLLLLGLSSGTERSWRSNGTGHSCETNPGLLLGLLLLLLLLPRLLVLLLLGSPLVDGLLRGRIPCRLLNIRLYPRRLVLLMLLPIRGHCITAHIPRPIARLQLMAVHQATGAALEERSSEDADIVLAAVRGMRIVAELFGAVKVCGQCRGGGLHWTLGLACRGIHSECAARRGSNGYLWTLG